MNPEFEDDEAAYQRAATAYFIWPLAAFELARLGPEAPRWVRIHARQALVFGLLAMFGYGFLMAIPLVIVLVAPEMPSGGVLLVYAAGIVLDAVAGLGLFALALFYSGRAARGDLFTIPLVATIVDRFLPVD